MAIDEKVRDELRLFVAAFLADPPPIKPSNGDLLEVMSESLRRLVEIRGSAAEGAEEIDAVDRVARATTIALIYWMDARGLDLGVERCPVVFQGPDGETCH